MSQIFLRIVNMSISAGWLVLAVLLVRFLSKKAPKWLHVLLWGFVAVRLLCPFTIESALSLIPSPETIPLNIEMDTTPAIHSGIDSINFVVNPMIADSNTPTPGASINPLQITFAIVSNIWILGAAVMMIYGAVSYWRLHRRLRTAVRYENNIYQCDYVSSPFVLGIIKPRIYLPFQSTNMEHIIAHEQAHIRRKDHWWKPLGFLLLSIHWFNPLMWLAYVLLCRDMELACDEKVIKTLDCEQRADYTQALLDCSVGHSRIAACPLAFGEVGVKTRVKSVLHYRKPAFWVIVIAALLCAAVGVCFLTDPAPKKLTLDDVVELSEKGKALTWSDFDDYAYIETGSGLYIRVYEIDEAYSLWIGGSGPDREIMYIRLRRQNDKESYLDIRTGNVAAFIGQDRSLYDPKTDSLKISVAEVGFYAFTTNSTKIRVKVQCDTDFSGTVILSDVTKGEPIEIAFKDVHPKETVAQFTHLTSARHYALSYSGSEDCTLVISDGDIFNSYLDWWDITSPSAPKPFYLIIGAEDVVHIWLSTPNGGGGLQNADSSPFKKGEKVWLEPLNRLSDLRGVTIIAADKNGEIIWEASVPDGPENEGFTRLTNDDWTISYIP